MDEFPPTNILVTPRGAPEMAISPNQMPTGDEQVSLEYGGRAAMVQHLKRVLTEGSVSQ
jgi:hypothetical protein